ncbi:hypothetical protein [Senegalia massiliensis]|nr:hypothetical protein [Senegalia massiliensis]
MRENDIKKVAIYLRKSRGDKNKEKDILSKHRLKLVEYAEEKKWEYVIYQEEITSVKVCININF